MLTTSHGIIGYLLFKNKWKKIWIYSFIWAILPDIPMIFSFIYFYFSSLILSDKEISHENLHNGYIDQLLSPLMHSLFLWLFVLLVIFTLKNKLTKLKILAFWIGGVSHIIIDFLTHQGKWTWNHLYPFNINPIEWLFYYLNPYFIITVHIIWGGLFLPKIYKYLTYKFRKWD